MTRSHAVDCVFGVLVVARDARERRLIQRGVAGRKIAVSEGRDSVIDFGRGESGPSQDGRLLVTLIFPSTG